jgi:hypothetical protein
MSLTLILSTETEAKLRQVAAESGKAPEDLAVEVLEKMLADEDSEQPLLPTDEWLRRFDGWVAAQKPRNPNFDDSRESIYPDR